MGQAKLGIDVGGTRLKMGLVAEGRVVQSAVVSMSSATVEDLVDTISTAIDALQRQSSWRVNAVGLGVAGVMSPGGQRVLESPNMPWLNGAPLATLLGERLQLPTHCDNDANCVGWGEAVAGAGAGCKDQICLALGTGVGGSLVLDGKLFHGVRGRGAELGHINIDPDGPPCGCGGRGCLEQYASKTGLLRMLDDYGLRSTGEDPCGALGAGSSGRGLGDRHRQPRGRGARASVGELARAVWCANHRARGRHLRRGRSAHASPSQAGSATGRHRLRRPSGYARHRRRHHRRGGARRSPLEGLVADLLVLDVEHGVECLQELVGVRGLRVEQGAVAGDRDAHGAA